MRIVKDLDLDLTGRHVLLVEDIVDSGLTLSYLRKNLLARNPASPRGVRPAGAQGPPEARPRPALRRLRDPARLRDRLRPRRRRALPEPSRTCARTQGPEAVGTLTGREKAPPLSRVLRPARPAGASSSSGALARSGDKPDQAPPRPVRAAGGRRRGRAPPPSPTATARSSGELTNGDKYKVNYVRDDSDEAGRDPAHGARRRPRSRSTTRRTRCGGPSCQTFLPVILLIGAFLFVMNTMQGGGSRVMQFGKAKAKQVSKDQPKVTFADVAGADEAVEELQEIKEFLEAPAKFQAIGAKIPKGVLLFGPPGTGKTLLARAVAGEAGVPFFSISGSDFVEMFVGVGASRVRDLFEQAKASGARPSSSSTRSTPSAATAAPAWAAATTSGSRPSTSCWWRWTASTPRPASSSSPPPTGPTSSTPPCCGPGRFDRQIVVDRPDLEGRQGHPQRPRQGQAPGQGRRRRRAGPAHARLHRRRPGQPHERGRPPHRPPGLQGDRHAPAGGGHRPGHRRPRAQVPDHLREGEAGHRLPRGRPRPGRPRPPRRRPHPQGLDHRPGPGPGLDARPAHRGQVPHHPLRPARPAGHAPGRAHGRGADLPGPHHRRPERHRAGHRRSPGPWSPSTG